MKIIYSEKEKETQKLRSTIAKYCYKLPKGYDYSYGPFHELLARHLYSKGYRKKVKTK